MSIKAKGLPMRTPLTMICTILFVGAAVAGAAEPVGEKDAKVARFERLLQRVQTDPGGVAEPEVMDLLKLANSLGRSYITSLAMGNYLQHNFRASPELVLAAADSAFRAGDYNFAVTPWFRVTADVQWIDDFSGSNEGAWFAGFRTQVKL